MSSHRGVLPPGPKRAFPGCHAWALRRRPALFLAELAQKYGDVVSFRVGLRRVYLLNHPDFIRDVLVTHAHRFAPAAFPWLPPFRREEWRASPCEGLLENGELTVRAAEMSARWGEGHPLNLLREMNRLFLPRRDEAAPSCPGGRAMLAGILARTLHLLALHPGVSAALEAEADTALQGRLPAAADAGRLPYARMVFAETLRLYPPVRVLARLGLADHTLGGYPFPRGAAVLVSPWVTHRDPRYYPDPARFEPLRWRPEARRRRPPFAYFPFGGGPHACPDEARVWTAGALVLAAVVSRWRLRPLSGVAAWRRPRGLWVSATLREERRQYVAPGPEAGGNAPLGRVLG